MNEKTFLFWILALILIIPNSWAAISTDRFSINGDTFVEQNTADTDHSADTYYQVQWGSNINKARTYLNFTIINITSGKIIDDAELTVSKYGGLGTGGSVILGTYDVYVRDYSISKITYNNQPCGYPLNSSCNSTATELKSTSGGAATLTFNITSIVRSAYNTGQHDVFLTVSEETGTGNQDNYFRSKEYPSLTNYVDITYSDIPPPITKPNMTITYPANNASHVNRILYPFSVNGTIQSPDGIYNISIDASFMKLISNQTEITNTYISWKFTESSPQGDGNYSFKLNSTNAGGTSYANIALYLDTENPTISISPYGACIDTANTIGSLASDTNLYKHDSSLYRQNLTGLSPFTSKNLELFNSAENINILTITDIINYSIDAASDINGIYRLKVNASDSHTLAMIPAYEVKADTKENSILFKTKDNEITFRLIDAFFAPDDAKTGPIEISKDILGISAAKEIDKYLIQIPFLKSGTEIKGQYFYKFIVTASQPIVKVAKNTGYRGHFVSGNNWIDFEPYDVTLKEIDKYSWEVSFYTKEKDILFNSLGELNAVSAAGIYYVSGSSPVISVIALSNNSIINNSESPTIGITAICYSPISLQSPDNFTIYLNNASWDSADCNGEYLSNYTAMLDECSYDISGLAAGAYTISFSCTDTCSKNTYFEYDFNIITTYVPPLENPENETTTTTLPTNYTQVLGTEGANLSCPNTIERLMFLFIIAIIALGLLFAGLLFMRIFLIASALIFFVTGCIIYSCSAVIGISLIAIAMFETIGAFTL